MITHFPVSVSDVLSLLLNQNINAFRQDRFRPSVHHFHPLRYECRNITQDDLCCAELSFLNILIYLQFLDMYKQSHSLANTKLGHPDLGGLYTFLVFRWFSAFFPCFNHAVSLKKPSVHMLNT